MKRYLQFKRKMQREGIPEKEQDILMNVYESVDWSKVRGNENV